MQILPAMLLIAEAGVPPGGWGHFVRWVGNFHPPLTAFPVAMLLGAALAELLRLLRGPSWLDGASRWCVILGAGAAIVTVPLGWALAVNRGSSWVLETHRWLGTAAGAGAIIVLVLSDMARRPGKSHWLAWFRTMLFLAVPLVGATGFFGGAMVFGLHEYDWNPPGHETMPATEPAGPGAVAIITMTDQTTFNPDKLTISLGTTVRWQNVSKDIHTVTADPKLVSDAGDVALPPGATPFHSDQIKPGGTFEHEFTVAGTYKYVCRPHEEMEMAGQIVVEPAR